MNYCVASLQLWFRRYIVRTKAAGNIGNPAL